ncbi:MAG: hypothetical protein NT007_00455 [Candidatus Kapabacteria bacterium]|nr:hypothetical protein [Candidatus Kapabacteria bacterium]
MEEHKKTNFLLKLDEIKNLLIEFWGNSSDGYFKSLFAQGLIFYESQLQAELYFFLRNRLNRSYHVWANSAIYICNEEDKTNPSKHKRPDLIIASEDKVIAVIEIKFKPWENIYYADDMNKLSDLGKINNKLILGMKPISSNWEKQKHVEERIQPLIDGSHLNCIIVFTEYESITLPNADLKNLLYLTGYIKDENNFPENIQLVINPIHFFNYKV